jgi:hypothetical protein
MKKSTIFLGTLFLYLITAGISYAVFTRISPPSVVNPAVNPGTSQTAADQNALIVINPGEPKTEACPLNGELYTKSEKEAWDKRRPLIIMIENSTEARPQSGLIRSDVIYETVAEGGVTRFMAVYYCDAQRSSVLVAPVRSVRTYFIDWASEYGQTPLFGHVLGANCSAETPGGPCKSDPRTQALEQLSKYGWRYAQGNDLDQAAIGAPAYKRNEARLFAVTGNNVATEHSMEGSTELLWKIGEKRGWTNLDPKGTAWTASFQPWKFKTDAVSAEQGAVRNISYDFWSGYKQFDAGWTFDPAANSYVRSTGGAPHKDLETGQPLTAKNVVVIFTKQQTSVDPLQHSLYATTGEGDALIFQDGNVIKATWKKKDRLGRTVFYTKKGQEVTFNPGRIWLSVVDKGTNVAYEQS